MFLASTALKDFWDASKEILFLGSWCPASCHSTAGFERPYHLMPSPWDDRDRYYRAAAYVDACSEALLRELSHYLTAFMEQTIRKDIGESFWGPWLILYTSIIYDRFVHLKAAFAEYRDLETIGMLESSYRVPADFIEAASFVAHDLYNPQIFSQLLKIMNHPFLQRPCKIPFGARSNRAVSPREHVLSFTERLIWLPFRSRAKAIIRGTNLSPIQSWRLTWATGFQTVPLEFNLSVSLARNAPVFDSARIGLGKLSSTDKFQSILTALLPTHFPTLYLEGYDVVRNTIRKEAEAYFESLRRVQILWYSPEQAAEKLVEI